MPDQSDNTPIQATWIAFTNAGRALFIPQADDRSLDQFLSLRDTVFAMVQSPKFLSDLDVGWMNSNHNPPDSPPEILSVLKTEMDAFRLSVEVANSSTESKGWRSVIQRLLDRFSTKGWRSKIPRLLGRFSTVTGSVKDLIHLSPYGKGAITLLKELADIFKERS